MVQGLSLGSRLWLGLGGTGQGWCWGTEASSHLGHGPSGAGAAGLSQPGALTPGPPRPARVRMHVLGM